MQFISNGFPHDIGQRYALDELSQGLVHQRLVIAAAHLSACFKNCQRVIIHAHRYPRLAAVFGLQPGRSGTSFRARHFRVGTREWH
jgi:hypothetical protein